MAVKAPPSAPAPVYSWTGFYVGGNVGVSWGRAVTDFNAAPVILDTNAGLISIPGFVGSSQADPVGIIGGGQIGYNWQFSSTWVAGLEADIQASGERQGNNFTTTSTSAGPELVDGTAVTQYDAKISWFGTVRGRIGYVWDRLMLYATGGLAYGEVELAGTRTVSGVFGPIPWSITSAIGHSQVNTGWTVGAGLEGALFANWTLKPEYLYVDLGSLDDPDSVFQLNSVSGGQTITHTRFTDNIFRVGLNYQFH
jgi:outer membrane immunogenic protein